MKRAIFLVLFAFGCGSETAEIEKLGDEVCACKDFKCGEEKMKKIGELSAKLIAGKSDKELKKLADRIEGLRERMTTCLIEIRKNDKSVPKEPVDPAFRGDPHGGSDPHGH